MNRPVDQNPRAADRGPTPGGAAGLRSFFRNYLLPTAVVTVGLGGVIWVVGNRDLSAKVRSLGPLLAGQAVGGRVEDSSYQATGWVEPRPAAIVVSAMTEGVVDRIVVTEGQQVKQGEPIAYLLDQDAKLSLDEAKANLEYREAEELAAKKALAVAQTNYNEPVPRQAELATAEAELGRVLTEQVRLPFQIRAAQARLNLAEKELESKSTAAETVASLSIHRARAEVEETAAVLAEQQAQKDSLVREVKAWTMRRDALQKLLSLRTEETQQLAEAEANVKAAAAMAVQARVALDRAKLRIERLVVRAPVAGTVLDIVARPGKNVMGVDSAEHEGSTIVTLYDPKSLQVRMDVGLQEVSKIYVGQQVRIETLAAKNPIKGTVLGVSSCGDESKESCQVKVQMEMPPAVVKPDMHVQVTFLETPPPGQSTTADAERQAGTSTWASLADAE
ncbi:MAG: HlyD family efflux transporter periplasmic adaptor subunit [Planctomycetota bacterium]